MRTDIRSRRRRALLVPGAALIAALAISGPAAAAPAPAAPSIQGSAPVAGSVAQGIIMRDGGVCDPIRHMGC